MDTNKFFTSNPMVDSYNCRASLVTLEDDSTIICSTLLGVEDGITAQGEARADEIAYRLELAHILATALATVSTDGLELAVLQTQGSLPPRTKLRDRLVAFI